MRTTVSGYRLDHVLHRGRDHEVWLARRLGSDRSVVAKRASGSAETPDRRALVREAGVLATAAHPNVVELIEVVDDLAGPMLVLARVEGGSLRGLLDERGTLTPGEMVAVLVGVAAAVGHLASVGVVHGDLRPDHILLAADGTPVLVGFGAAASRRDRDRDSTTADDPTYLHPGVAAGGRPDARSEVFALGAVAYECLTGRVPHRGTPAEVIALAAAEVHRPLSSWPSVPPAMAELVEQALGAEPGGVADAATFVTHLRSTVEPEAVVRPHPRVDHAQSSLGPGPDETLLFGPRPPDPNEEPPVIETWRVVAAAVIATVAVVALWFVAGLAVGV